MTSRLLQLVDTQCFQSLPQFLLYLWGQDHLQRASPAFSIRRSPHVNNDCRKARTVSVNLLDGALITRCNHPDRVFDCRNSLEFYISSQSGPLAENLTSPANQSNHCRYFDWSAVRSLHINIHVDCRIFSCMLPFGRSRGCGLLCEDRPRERRCAKEKREES